MSASGIIGTYFFENEAGNAVTVNADRYVEMLQNFFTPQLTRFPVNENVIPAGWSNKPHTRISTQLMLCCRTESFQGMGISHGPLASPT